MEEQSFSRMQITNLSVVFDLSKLSPAECNEIYKSSLTVLSLSDWLVLLLIKSLQSHLAKVMNTPWDGVTWRLHYPATAGQLRDSLGLRRLAISHHSFPPDLSRPGKTCKLYSENSRQHCRQGKYSATPLSCLRSKKSLLHNTIYLFWTNSRETFVFFNG